MLLPGKSDPKARSQLTSQPLDPAPASAEAFTCPSREVREGSFGELAPQGHGRDQGTIVQHAVRGFAVRCCSGATCWLVLGTLQRDGSHVIYFTGGPRNIPTLGWLS